MIKKIFISFILFSLFLTNVNLSFAQTAAPTVADDTVDDKINSLKDKIASRVAELKLVEKRGFYGAVIEISGTQLTVTDQKNATRFIDVDELTKFSSPSAKESFGISDITKGTKIAIIGLYNKQSKRLLARFIDVSVIPTTLRGVVTSVNKTDFTFTLLNDSEKEYTIDVGPTTKTNTWDDDGLTKAGFSKIAIDQPVIASGYFDKNDKTLLIANRIIIFPNFPVNPNILRAKNALPAGANAPASTGSGNKMTPITK